MAEGSGNSVHKIVARGVGGGGPLKYSPHKNMWCGARWDTPAGHLGPISLHYVSWRRSLHRRWMCDRTVAGLWRPPGCWAPHVVQVCVWARVQLAAFWEGTYLYWNHRGYKSSTYHTPLGVRLMWTSPPLRRWALITAIKGSFYTMDHEVVPRPCRICDWFC